MEEKFLLLNQAYVHFSAHFLENFAETKTTYIKLNFVGNYIAVIRTSRHSS